MNPRGLPAAEAAARAAEFPRASQESFRAPRRRNPAVEAETATATRSTRRSRVLWWAEPRPPPAAAAADDGGFAIAELEGAVRGSRIEGGYGITDQIKSNGLDLANRVTYLWDAVSFFFLFFFLRIRFPVAWHLPAGCRTSFAYPKKPKRRSSHCPPPRLTVRRRNRRSIEAGYRPIPSGGAHPDFALSRRPPPALGNCSAIRRRWDSSFLVLNKDYAVLEYYGFLSRTCHSHTNNSFVGSYLHTCPSCCCHCCSKFKLFQTHLAGKGFEYNEEGLQRHDLFVQFCKDVQRRSGGGFIKFGNFVGYHSFLTGTEHIDYIQKFHYGDLVHCETTFQMMGRTAQVNIICGHCSNKACKDEQGCICSISFDELMCRVVIELAIHCSKSGPRVFKGFTIGFHPRSSEIVYDGLTQLGFEKLHHGFSFQTEQIHVSLYLSAMSSLSGLVGKPTFKVNPVKGLGVTLTGSAVDSALPTTLSPTVLNLVWRCEIARSSPYEVNILIPVEGYDPVEFTLSKKCDYKQQKVSDPMKGWATFGIFVCIFIILSSLFCCGCFIYKRRVENLHGFDALPGMAVLSAFLNAVGGQRGYIQVDNPSESPEGQAYWERAPGTAQVAQRTNDRTYGSI